MTSEALVVPYQELRRDTLARDRGLREKVMSLEEAAQLVRDGEHVAIGGCTLSRTPMAMIWASSAPKEEPDDLAVDHLDRGRSVAGLGGFQSRHYQLVFAGHRLGRVEGHAPLHREQIGALR